MPISRQPDHDLSFDEDSASASSIDIGTGLGNRPLGGGTGGAGRSRGGGEFGGAFGGDSYSFSVPGTESYLRDDMGSRGTSAKTGGAAKAVTKWAAKSVVRKPAIDDMDFSNRPGTKTGTKKEADLKAFLENDSGSASSIDLRTGGASAARPKADKAKPEASSKSGTTAAKAVSKSAAIGGAEKAVTKWAAKSIVRKPAIDDLDPSNRPGAKTGTKKGADFNAFLENDSGSASSIDLRTGGASSAARAKAGKAKPEASSKSGTTAAKAATKPAAKGIVRKTAINADLDDRFRQMGMKTTGGLPTSKKASDFNAFLEASDSDEEKPPKAAPKEVPKGQTEDSASASASPEASPRSGAVLSRSPAKISNFAKKTKSPGDASPSPSQVSRSASRSAPVSPRSASPSRSPSQSHRSPSPSQSARSRSNTPRTARSVSPSRSARSRSASSGLSAGSVRSPPAAGTRQMSDLVMPQVAKAGSTTPGVTPAKASPPLATQRSESPSGGNYTEDFTADSGSVPARRPSMSYQASSGDAPKPATKAATSPAAKRPFAEATSSRSPSQSARSRSASSGLSAGSVRSPPAAGTRQMSDLVMPQVAKAAPTTPGVAPAKASPPLATQRSESPSGDNYTEDFTADSASVPARRPSMSYQDDFEASSGDALKPATKAATSPAAKRLFAEATSSRSPSQSARSRSASSGLSAGSVRSPPSPPATGISSTFGKIRQMSDLVVPQVAQAAPTTPGVAQVKESSASASVARQRSMTYEDDFEASSVDTPKPTTKAATSPAKAAVAAPVPAATSGAKPGFTGVAIHAGSAVPKLALDPLKSSQPAVPLAPVAMAQAAEPRNAWIEERPKPATRDANIQVSIPVDVGVQCDLLSDPTRGGWQQQMPWPHFPPQAEHFKGPTSQPMQAGPWWPPYAYSWPWPFPGAMGPMGSMGSMGPMGPAPVDQAGASQPGRGQLGPALWALRMVDDSFRDQIDLLRQAAARHRSLLEKSRGAASRSTVPS